MARSLKRGDRLVMASHNKGKLREFDALLRPHGLSVASAAKYGLPEPEETGTTFEANAELKALAAAKATGLPALSDDSGLSVADLGGAPGIYSARWAGPAKDFGHAMKLVEERLAGLGIRAADAPRAAFVAVLCLAFPDGESEVFRGEVDGRLTFPPRGKNGFGYDPIFIPDGFDITFGEMDPSAKEAMSHRARAFARFAAEKLP